MRIEDIEIHTGNIDRPYKTIGYITAKVGAATAFSKTPTIEDVNFKLKEEAIKRGANAIINVSYDRGISMTSWKALSASGTAILMESDEVKCPFCAETIKRAATICRYCGKDQPEFVKPEEKVHDPNKIYELKFDYNKCVNCPICNAKLKLDSKEIEKKQFGCPGCQSEIKFAISA